MFMEVSGGNFQERFLKKERCSSYGPFSLFIFFFLPPFAVGIGAAIVWGPAAISQQWKQMLLKMMAKQRSRRSLGSWWHVNSYTNPDFTWLRCAITWNDRPLLFKPPSWFFVLAGVVIPDTNVVMQEAFFVLTTEWEGTVDVLSRDV